MRSIYYFMILLYFFNIIIIITITLHFCLRLEHICFPF